MIIVFFGGSWCESLAVRKGDDVGRFKRFDGGGEIACW